MKGVTNGLVLLGIATMLAMALVTYVTFFTAYTSPTKSARVHINNYGEAEIEMIMLSVLLPLNIISTLVIGKRLSEKSRDERIMEYLERTEQSYSQ